MAKNGEKWRWRICLFHLSNSPFRHWPPPALVPIILYIFMILLDQSHPIWLGSYYHPDDDDVLCNYNVGKVLGKDSTQFKIYWTLHILINRMIIPSIVITCCVLSSVKIWRESKTKVGCVEERDGRIDFRQKRKNEATKTVVWLGIFYIILNLPYNVIYSIFLYDIWNESAW